MKTIKKLVEYIKENKKIIIVFITVWIVTVVGLTIFFILRNSQEKFDAKKVVFKSSVIESEVKEILGKECTNISELLNITEFNLINKSELVDLTDLKLFKNLRTLTISNCSVSDLSPLSQLNYLEKIEVSSCRVSDFRPIQSCRNLRVLNLSDNEISDIGALSNGFDKIEEFSFNNNAISEIKNDFSRFKFLTKLNLNRNLITNIEFLNGIKKLEIVQLDDNKLSGTVQLPMLEHLMYVSLAGNSLDKIQMNKNNRIDTLVLSDNCFESLATIESARNIKSLDLSKNPIRTLEGIVQFENLESLNIRNTQIISSNKLSELKNFCSIFVNDSFDRHQLDFMVGNFSNCDQKTKIYLLEKQYYNK